MSYSSEVLADSPVLWWKLDETSGATATDSSGNGRHGTYVASPSLNAGTVRPGVNGVGLTRGSAQRVGFTGSGLPAGASARSLECWFVPSASDAGTLAVLGGGAAGTQIFDFSSISVSGTQYLFTDGVNGGNNKTLAAGQYPSAGILAHAVFTFDGTTWKYYLNGTLVTSGTFSVPINTTSPSFYAGNRVDVGGQGLTGRLGDVALYSTALSAARILAHYQAAVPVPTDTYGAAVMSDSPFGFWRLDEASGSIAVDSSGNGRHGTYVGTVILGAQSLIGAGSSALFAGGHVDLDAYDFTGLAASAEAWIRPSSYPHTFGYIVGTENVGATQCFNTRLGLGKPTVNGTTTSNEVVGAPGLAPVICPPTHVVVTFESSTYKVYVNGALVVSAAAGGATLNCNGPTFRIAENPFSSNGGDFIQTFAGEIDEVAVYKSALSAARVLAHFQAATPPQCEGWVVGSVGRR